MTTACVLLAIMGVLGATDIVLFHVWLHGLRGRRESRAELVTHFLRGPTYAVLFVVMPNVDLQGAWFAALLGLLGFDALISVADFWLERDSREGVGGLPRGEYLLHVFLAGLFGAMVFAVMREAPARLDAATSITWMPMGSGPAPDALRVMLLLMSPVVLWTGLLDLRAVIRLGRDEG